MAIYLCILNCKTKLSILLIAFYLFGFNEATDAIPGVEFDILQRDCPASDIAARVVSSWTAQSHLMLCLGLCFAAADLTGLSSTACAAALYRDSDGLCGLLDSSQLGALLAAKTAAAVSATGCPGRQIWIINVRPEETTPATTTKTTAATTTTTTAATTESTSTAFMSTTTELPGATYLGCYADKVSDRDLSKNKITSDSMSRSMCLAHCHSKNRKYFGLQYREECFCDNNYGKHGGRKPESDCDLECRGNSKEICGGNSRNSVYEIL